MFVGNDIVGIVGSGAVITEASKRLPWQRPPGNSAIRSIIVPMRALQHLLEIAQLHRSAMSGGRREARFLPDLELLGPQSNQIALNLVIAERPKQPRGCRDGAGRGFGVTCGVEAEKPHDAALVVHGEPGRHAGALGSGHRQDARRRTTARVRATHRFIDRQRSSEDSVREPARVGHFVDRRNVQCASAVSVIARIGKKVHREIESEIDLPRLNA